MTVDLFGNPTTLSSSDSKKLFTVRITLPSDFYDECLNRINDGVDEGTQKWGVFVSEEERQDIIENSVAQIESRLSCYSKSGLWSFADSELLARTSNNVATDSRVLNLPEDAGKYDVYMLMKPRLIAITNESTGDNVVHVSEFYNHAIELFYSWCSTAGFYAVGSLKN